MKAHQKTSFTTVSITGLIAITVNTVLLKLAPTLGIKAESGGLLKLVFKIIPSLAGISFLHSVFFWIVFHFLTGFVMVLLYFLISIKIRINKWVRGTLFSFIPWLINGMIVLPILGQGVMGIDELPLSGIIYFFLANLVFALLTAVLSET